MANGTGGFRAPDALDRPGTVTLTQTGPGARRRSYIVRTGDTLAKIAARRDVFNDPDQWKAIRDANNGMRDSKLPKKWIGKQIKIPAHGRAVTEVTAYLTGAVVPVAGYGGWSRVARPRRIALTEWVGRDAMSLEIPFMFDTFAETELDNPGMYVEDQIRQLERLAGIDETDPEPPIFEITSSPSKLIPHNERRAGHVSWFVETLTWDPAMTISNNHGNRVRSAGTVTITQHVADQRLRETSVAKARKKATKKKKSKKK